MTSPPNITTRWNATITRSNFTQFTKVQLPNTSKDRSGQLDANATERMQIRKEYPPLHYNPNTGIRIATTLSGFFLLVLLILFYKSKCKKHSSREGTPVHSTTLASILPNPINPDFCNNSDEDRIRMLDPSQFINLNQIQPYNHCTPHLANNKGHQHHWNYPMPHPAVLLTAANSESSDEEVSTGSGSGLTKPLRPLINQQNSSNCHRHKQTNQYRYLNPSTLSPLIGTGRSNRLQQNIDIHVILPTPTISPSSSEHFCPNRSDLNTKKGVSNVYPNLILGSPNGASSIGYEDRDRSSSVGSANSTFAGAFTGNPLFFLENLKYVDDTSSENIPTNEDQDQDTRSIGSDSVFACFDHNFDHVASGYARRVSSVSGYSGLSSSIGYAGLVAGSPKDRDKASVSGTEDEESDFKITMTQAQVHHRDSFCSELESINDYLESNRRRSSSTQTTFSDLQQCFSLSWTGSGSGGHSPRLSPRLVKQLAAHPSLVGRQNPALLSVGQTAPNPLHRVQCPSSRKRSVDTLLLRKAYSLQCDEPVCTSTNCKRKK